MRVKIIINGEIYKDEREMARLIKDKLNFLLISGTRFESTLHCCKGDTRKIKEELKNLIKEEK